MPDFPIIDAHVHLYDIERLRYGWMAGVPSLNRTTLMADFDAARGAVAVAGLVFVEVDVDPGLHREEAAFAQGLADADPRLLGIVAHAPVEKGAGVEDDLAALAANPRLRGIRRLIQGERDPSIVLAESFVEGVRRVGRRGLVFDLCIRHWQMAYAIELVRRCPDTRFVLDHIGKPDIRNGLRDPWWSELRRLAALPNVAVKLSGVVTEADHKAWKPSDVEPYIAHTIETFGFERTMFGSDWTVSTLTHAYPTWVELVDAAVAGASGDEKRALFAGTARRVYSLG